MNNNGLLFTAERSRLPESLCGKEDAYPWNVGERMFISTSDIGVLESTGAKMRVSRRSAAQSWRKCPSCDRELFSEDRFCLVCKQCIYCCNSEHIVRTRTTPGHAH